MRIPSLHFWVLLCSASLVVPTASWSQTGQPTETTLTSSANPVVPGTTVMFIATVRLRVESGAQVSGEVEFHDGSTLLGRATIASNEGRAMAILSDVTLAEGAHPIIARYTGDAALARSESAPFILLVKTTE